MICCRYAGYETSGLHKPILDNTQVAADILMLIITATNHSNHSNLITLPEIMPGPKTTGDIGRVNSMVQPDNKLFEQLALIKWLSSPFMRTNK